MTQETLEQLKRSKLAVIAESRALGILQARNLIDYSPDFDLLAMLYGAACAWRDDREDFGEALDYVNLNGSSAFVNGGILDGFCSEIIAIYTLLLESTEVTA